MPETTRKASIAIIACSGYAPDPATCAQALARLRAQGHDVHDYTQPSAKFQRFGGSDSDRLAQLHAAARNPAVQIVLALRGGYGMSRLLPQIDFKLLADSGKLFVGHSDFTALQAGLLTQTGAISFAGPMLCDDFSRADLSDFTHAHFWQCLSQPSGRIHVEATGNPGLAVQGRLWGGNLSMLTHLIGTPWMPQIENGILFIEDINEHPYRVERMLLQLQHAGVLDRQQAVLFGDFGGYRLSDYDNGYDFAAMLEFMRSRSTVPLLQGLPFGHIRDKVTLPVGAPVRLQSDAAGFTLEFSGYPSLAG
jgi:muramoyltetrapeptide carboxypeptidase